VELYRQEFIIYTREILLREDLVSSTGIFLSPHPHTTVTSENLGSVVNRYSVSNYCSNVNIGIVLLQSSLLPSAFLRCF
jgi:hypothetical protein